MEKHIVWSNYDLDPKDWKDLREENPGMSEAEFFNLICETNAEYLEEEKANLDKYVNGDIIVIADIGRWNGRFPGYARLENAKLSDCLAVHHDYAEFYVDEDGDFKTRQTHHDGTSYATFRIVRPEANENEEKFEDFLMMLYNGTASQEDIDKYTLSLGAQVAEVYGWKVG